MNFNQLFATARGRAGLPLTVAAMLFVGIGDARSEQEITPEDVYYFACAQCHKAGLNAAPKYGDSKAWTPRIEQGRDTVYKNSINGKGAMPPKGGRTTLTDEQVEMAVDYMVNAVGGWPKEK